MTVKKAGYTEIVLPFDNLMPIVDRALQMAGFTITMRYPAAITAQKGISMATWGSNIRVDVVALNPTTCRINMTSETALPTVVVDWGEQEKNVRKFFQTLHQLVAQYTQYNLPKI